MRYINALLVTIHYSLIRPSARSITILSPSETRLRTVASPTILPNTLTALAGRISAPLLARVGPKKMHNAFCGSQYPRSPISTSYVWFSSGAIADVEKYISSPHLLTMPVIGSAAMIADAVPGQRSSKSFASASSWASPAPPITILILANDITIRLKFSKDLPLKRIHRCSGEPCIREQSCLHAGLAEKLLRVKAPFCRNLRK